MQSDEAIPEYLQDIYKLLKCAYPNGISHDDYWIVLSILHQVMSFWTIADVLSVLANKDRSEVYNDASGFGLDPLPSVEELERVQRELNACGYEEWFRRNTS